MMFIKAKILLTALSVIMLTATAHAASYYVNSNTGNDANNGLSPARAWKTLANINAKVFAPGDEILLASGSQFKGQLAPKGGDGIVGQTAKPIVVASYEQGKRPRIDGEGKVEATVFLHNVQGWELNDLEITNQGAARQKNRNGVLVLNEKHETARHIVLRNLYVHNVNGTLPKGQEAGCAIRVKIGNGHKKRFDGLLIEKCHIKDCERNGILVLGGPLREQWFPSRNVVIRRNLIEGVGGDGILPASCDGALVEWNIMRDCPRYGEELGAAAGIWPWSCDNTILQFNEVSDHKGWVDGQAYDCDYNCNGTIYQYNLSHNNEGGFMLLCSPGITNNGWLKNNTWNRGSIVRYNLSINDGSRTTGGNKHYFSPTFHLSGGTTQDSKIYSNLIIIPKKTDAKMDTKIFGFDNWGGKYPVNTLIRDNVFWTKPGQQGTFDFGNAKQVSISNNNFIGEIQQVKETKEVKPANNQHLPKLKDAVKISGDAESLANFRKFLKVKGDPHVKAGLKIAWPE